MAVSQDSVMLFSCIACTHCTHYVYEMFLNTDSNIFYHGKEVLLISVYL